jgi:hypothetical protein
LKLIANDFKHLQYLGFTEYHIRSRGTGGDTQTGLSIRESVLNLLENSGIGFYNYQDSYPCLIVSVRGTAELVLALRYGVYIDKVIKPQKERVK